MSRKHDIEKQIESHNNRLQLLKQQAIKGLPNIDPSITIEIEQIEKIIEELQTELKEITGRENLSLQISPPTFGNPYSTGALLVSHKDDRRLPDDLHSIIKKYRQLIQDRQYDEAWKLYKDCLCEPLYYQFGAYQWCIKLLCALFPDGEDQPPALSLESAQSRALNQLANSFSLVGQPIGAIPLYERAILLSEKHNNKKRSAMIRGALASVVQIPTGALEDADDNLRQSITLFSQVNNRQGQASGHQELGRVLAYCGNWTEAKAALDMALKQDKRERAIQGQSVTWAYRALLALLQQQKDEAFRASQEALRLVNKMAARTKAPFGRDYMNCYWLLGWAYLAREQPEMAQIYLHKALNRCRTINGVYNEPSILLALARLAATQSELTQAKGLAKEAHRIAEQAGYRLDLADIHNFSAKLALVESDRETARDHAQQAKRYAYCDGPPYSYKVAYDEAEELLQNASGG